LLFRAFDERELCVLVWATGGPFFAPSVTWV
jgi:hypothetical protein